MTAPELLTTAEVAGILRCSTEHVAKLCKSKALPGRNLGGSSGWRVHRDDLETFVRGRKPRATADAGRRAAK